MPPLPNGLRVRLSFMMFLQFFIWGAWFVTLGTYLVQSLGFTGTQTASAYSTMPWGAIVAPFIVGMIVDRFFPAGRVLAVLHLAGAILLFWASTITDPVSLFWVLLAYAMCYNPTLALVNAISFHQLTDTERQFPAIRVFGTLGWIAAGVLVGKLGIEAQALPLQLAAACSALLGVYAFFLPHTPPRSAGQRVTVRDVLGLDALVMLKQRSFAVFVIGSLLICIPLAFYYNFTNVFLNAQGVANAAGKMTLGQASEVLFMIAMPFFFSRLGVKYMLLTGMAAWAGRYLLFAFGSPDGFVLAYYVGIALHGICFDFFFVTGQIYVDKNSPPGVRASAQGFITLITYGVGMLIGTWVSGPIVDLYVQQVGGDTVAYNWTAIWLWPAAMSGFVIAIFALFFRNPKTSAA